MSPPVDAWRRECDASAARSAARRTGARQRRLDITARVALLLAVVVGALVCAAVVFAALYVLAAVLTPA